MTWIQYEARSKSGGALLEMPTIMLTVESSSRRELEKLIRVIRSPASTDGYLIVEATRGFISSASEAEVAEHTETLVRACFALFEIGKSQLGIDLGIEIASVAQRAGNLAVQRRLYNTIGGVYGDILDFASSMKYLEMAIALARELRDPIAETACLSNIIAVLQEMGHYRQALDLVRRVLCLNDNSSQAANLKLQCASNGLFAAHRVGDAASASMLLSEGERYLGDGADLLRRVFFERSRVLFLIDSGQAQLAAEHVDRTLSNVPHFPNDRIRYLLNMSKALSQWGCGARDEARNALKALYEESASTRLYHHFVLQSLVKVYGDAETQADVEAGLGYARELVEFTTSVKKAKFYRQLQTKKAVERKVAGPEGIRSVTSNLATDLDPFRVSKEWLTSTNIDSASERMSSLGKREITKHEELTAIHEDMARLRVAGLRREIRTDAVDTAENWAIAAEFFDDETGQHCYRVGHLSSMLAREVGMDETFCIQIEHAARLHDIGKIAVNEVILLKPGPLDAAEMAAMRLHTEVGAQILAGSDDPTLRMAVEVARHHHEWWNGNGYPRRLSGRDIPLSARISAFADVYDALTHARAYKSAWSHERAVDEISRLSGTQFDPSLMEPFLQVLNRYLEDLNASAIPGFADMDSNSLIASRRKLMETIASA